MCRSSRRQGCGGIGDIPEIPNRRRRIGDVIDARRAGRDFARRHDRSKIFCASGPSPPSAAPVAGSTVWTGARLAGVAGVLLAVVALTVVERTFTHRRARDWARVGRPLLILSGALATNILIRLSLEALADT